MSHKRNNQLSKQVNKAGITEDPAAFWVLSELERLKAKVSNKMNSDKLVRMYLEWDMYVGNF